MRDCLGQFLTCQAVLTRQRKPGGQLNIHNSTVMVTPTLALNTEPSLAVKIGVPREFKPMCCVLLGYAGEDKFTTPRRELQNINYF